MLKKKIAQLLTETVQGKPLDNEETIPCSSFAMIEDILLSRNYSASFMDDLSWRIYLVLQLEADAKHGYTYSGNKHYNSFKFCNPVKYKEVMSRLKKMQLVDIKEPRGTYIYKYLYIAPIWDIDRNLPIVTFDVYKTKYSIKRNSITFAIVPKDCLSKLLMDRSLSVTHIRLLLKLYKYNNLPLFGGVDPNVLHLLEDRLVIHPRVLHDLSISYEESEEYLDDLSHYFTWNEYEVYDETFEMDTRLMLHSENIGVKETKVIKILTPIYQYCPHQEEKK